MIRRQLCAAFSGMLGGWGTYCLRRDGPPMCGMQSFSPLAMELMNWAMEEEANTYQEKPSW